MKLTLSYVVSVNMLNLQGIARKNLCGYCIDAWLGLDKRIGRLTTFEEFLDPTQIKKKIGR